MTAGATGGRPPVLPAGTPFLGGFVMRRVRFWATVSLLGGFCLFAPVAQSQPGKGKAAPRMEPVAEAKLLMEGIADPNFRGLTKRLREKPADAESWGYTRGQAHLIAETGNLLMLRPPKDAAAHDAWMALAADLRDAGAELGRAAGAKDYVNSRAGLAAVANACNRCHHAFRVPTRVNPFPDE